MKRMLMTMALIVSVVFYACESGTDNKETTVQSAPAGQGTSKEEAIQNYNTGVGHLTGNSGKKDSAEAAKYFRKSAEAGFAPAQYNLATLYERGEGVKQDMAEALKLYQKAADQGFEYAMNNLGTIYDHGKGVKRDEAEAFKWYKLAADRGMPMAMDNVGNMYAYGRSVKQNDAEAFKWFEKAATAGDPKAMYDLGAFYVSGRAVKADPMTGYMWLSLAAEHNISFSKEVKETTAKTMTAEQLEQAKKMIEERKVALSKVAPLPTTVGGERMNAGGMYTPLPGATEEPKEKTDGEK